MAYAFSFKDLKNGCDYWAKADTFEEAQKIVTGHFQHHHDVKEITPELQDKVNSAIRES